MEGYKTVIGAPTLQVFPNGDVVGKVRTCKKSKLKNMAFIYKWIEGRKNLDAYCEKRFGEKPRFVETIGRVGYEGAKVHMIYKHKANGGFAEMYLLYMQHPNGHVYWISDIETMSYEDIRADRTAILR